MYGLFWLIPFLPFAGYLALTVGGNRLQPKVAAWIGCTTVGLSAVLTLIMISGFLFSPPSDFVYSLSLWQWIPLQNLHLDFGLRMDNLSLVMASVITVVGFLIHLYSTEYMAGDKSYNRFFAYLNLFVSLMLLLVFADNLALLLLGWEGVGLCSYLLIGFWYEDPANGRAARKAFVVTRIGDIALLIGIFLLFHELGTLRIHEALMQAPIQWLEGSTVATVAAFLILGGAVGKSAQLPLQTWLPDAMAGPTPVSALIHAATMVTAGVYLIARLYVIFEMAPLVMNVVAVVGLLTLLLSGFAALAQSDLKRILAYSTISQIGYMFMALGAGAWAGALFHFMTHAWFKALLFLAAGSVISALHHEQNIFRMGGLRRKLPLVFWTFLIGSACLAALPLLTSGFYSKEKILWDVWISPFGGPWLWAGGILGAFITALYTTRMMALVFFGDLQTEVTHRPGIRINFVLIVLAVWSIIGGGIELPHTFGEVTFFSLFVGKTIQPMVTLPHGLDITLWLLLLAASATVVLGIAIGAWLYGPGYGYLKLWAASLDSLRSFWLQGWGFDALYDILIVRPYSWLAKVNRRDVIDLLNTLIVRIANALNFLLSQTQDGRLRRYVLGITSGTVILLLIIIFQ